MSIVILQSGSQWWTTGCRQILSSLDPHTTSNNNKKRETNEVVLLRNRIGFTAASLPPSFSSYFTLLKSDTSEMLFVYLFPLKDVSEVFQPQAL